MPPVAELLARVSFLAAMPAVAGILLTAGTLVVSREWRLNVLALTLQYFLVVLLLTRLIRPEVAAVKGLIGWMICMVLYVSERSAAGSGQSQTDAELRASLRARRWMMSARASFSLLAGTMVAVAAYTAALRIPLPVIPEDLSLACYLLAGLGLLLVGLSDTPMQVGMGLLTFVSGFDLFFVALEPSLAVAALLGALSFAIALVTVYLRSAQSAPGARSKPS
jgi:hypothetical protein